MVCAYTDLKTSDCVMISPLGLEFVVLKAEGESLLIQLLGCLQMIEEGETAHICRVFLYIIMGAETLQIRHTATVEAEF